MAEEQRKLLRKSLKVRASFMLDGSEAIEVRTADISAAGVGLLVPHPVTVGALGRIAMDMYFDGKSHPVRARIKAAHCIFGDGSFRVGFNFVTIEPATLSTIAQFMR